MGFWGDCGERLTKKERVRQELWRSEQKMGMIWRRPQKVKRGWGWEKENPRGRGRVAPPKEGDILGFDQRKMGGLALRTCGVGLAKGKGRIVLFVWEQRGSIASKENGGRKQNSKGNGFVVCSPERMTVTHTHTHSQGHHFRFYSILWVHVWFSLPRNPLFQTLSIIKHFFLSL